MSHNSAVRYYEEGLKNLAIKYEKDNLSIEEYYTERLKLLDQSAKIEQEIIENAIEEYKKYVYVRPFNANNVY